MQKDISKAIDPRRNRARITREQWVIQLVTNIIGSRANIVTSDDVASDILLELLNAGGFGWDEEEIQIFCRKRASSIVLRCMGRREIPQCEFSTDGKVGSRFGSSQQDLVRAVPANQETVVEANQALGLLRAIPCEQRAALEILCDGGNPINVAEDLDITPWAAIALIKEAREYIHRVDPKE